MVIRDIVFSYDRTRCSKERVSVMIYTLGVFKNRTKQVRSRKELDLDLNTYLIKKNLVSILSCSTRYIFYSQIHRSLFIVSIAKI